MHDILVSPTKKIIIIRERGGGGDGRSSTASYDPFRLSPAASVAPSLPLQQQQLLLLLLLLRSALVDCCMFNHALSAVAPHRPLLSTPPLFAVSPLSSAVVVVRHCYCPHRPPSTAVRRRQRHRCPPSLTPLSTTVVDSAHRLHCPSSAVLVYICSLPSPSTILRLSHPSTSSSADGNDDDASFGCHWQRWMAAMAVATSAVSCGGDGMEATPPLLVVRLHHRPHCLVRCWRTQWRVRGQRGATGHAGGGDDNGGHRQQTTINYQWQWKNRRCHHCTTTAAMTPATMMTTVAATIAAALRAAAEESALSPSHDNDGDDNDGDNDNDSSGKDSGGRGNNRRRRWRWWRQH